MEKKAWQRIEDEVDMVLRIAMADTVDKKIRSKTTIIYYSMEYDRYGPEQKAKG